MKKLIEICLPLLIKKGNTDTVEEGFRWNYSPNVNSYYPKGYINFQKEKHAAFAKPKNNLFL